MLPGKDDYIRLENIVKIYHTGAGDYLALDHIQLSFRQAEFASVVGRSGSGKSTLMNMLTGIDRPTSGKVYINGTEIQAMSENERARWRGRNLGIIFQFYQLLPVFTLLENVMLPMQFYDGGTPAELEARAYELLRLVGVEEHAHKLPGNVSGGQQQSAAIARALANSPPVLIADEPTGNLGTRAGENIIKIFVTLAEQGKTIIMVTHDEELAQRAQRVLTIADGRIVGDMSSLC